MINLNIENMRFNHKCFTEKLTDSHWEISVGTPTTNNEWLGVFLKLLYKPEAINSIMIITYFQINSMDQQNIHSMITKYDSRECNTCCGYNEFIPLKVIENWKEINVQCWVAMDYVEAVPWICHLSSSR